MNMRMPVINAYKAIKLIKAKKKGHGQKSTNHCRTIIIALTASTKEQDQKKIISIPINGKIERISQRQVYQPSRNRKYKSYLSTNTHNKQRNRTISAFIINITYIDEQSTSYCRVLEQ